MEPLDWGDGDYSRTAAALAPAAEALVEFTAVAAGQRVLDVACGTGNAALAAAERGATVTGVDPAVALIERAAARAVERGLEARWLRGGADALPVDDGAFDLALSVFGVIFAPEPAAAAAELARAVRPGGSVALTAWKPAGPINTVGGLIFTALDLPAGQPRNWGDRDWTTATLEAAGTRDVRIGEAELVFTAESAEAWWRDQAAHHPVWRWARRQLGQDRWRELHAEGVAALEAANEDPGGFRTTSGYLLVTTTVP